MAGTESGGLERRIRELEDDRDALWRELRALRVALAGAAAMLMTAVPGSS